MNFGENWKFNPHFGRGRSEQVQQKGKSTGKKKQEDFVEVFLWEEGDQRFMGFRGGFVKRRERNMN